MRSRPSSDELLVRVDLGTLPRTWRLPVARWLPWLWGTYTAVAAYGVVRLRQGERPPEPPDVVIAVLQLVIGAGLVLVWRQMAVRLEPTGYRVGSVVLRSRLQPWSRVAEVRAPGPGTGHAEIRGTRASDSPLALAGMTAEQAEELQRRLAAAREGTRTGGAA